MSDQFSDAPGDDTTLNAIGAFPNTRRDPTRATAYIDDPIEEDIPDSETETDVSLDEYYDSEDEKEWRTAADHGVDDEDWEIAEKGNATSSSHPSRPPVTSHILKRLFF